MFEAIQLIISSLLGAAATGIPLYRKLTRIQADVARDAQKLDKEQVKIDEAKTINKEEEWKRIIHQKDTDLQRLRDRDDAQEKQIMDLYGRFIEAQKSEARKDERINILRDHMDKLTILLTNRCPECPHLQEILLGLNNDRVANATSPASSLSGKIATGTSGKSS